MLHTVDNARYSVRRALSIVMVLLLTLSWSVQSLAVPTNDLPSHLSNLLNQQANDDDFSILDELDLEEGVIAADATTPLTLDRPENFWLDIASPIGLILFFFLFLLAFRQIVKFTPHREYPLLHDYPTGVIRGIAMAVVFYGIAFAFGALEAYLQVQTYGSSYAYFSAMSDEKIVAFTHAHLFGFTTSFLIIGVPFTLNFAHLKYYQWLLPIGLTASAIDVASWWGIKYVSPNFEWVSIFCAALFTFSYGFMLIGLLRVSLFPGVRWMSDRRDRPAGDPRSIKPDQ